MQELTDRNAQRAARFAKALAAYKILIYGKAQSRYEPDEQAVGDMLSDMRHYCAAERIDFDWKIALSQDHFHAETRHGE